MNKLNPSNRCNTDFVAVFLFLYNPLKKSELCLEFAKNLILNKTINKKLSIARKNTRLKQAEKNANARP
jgi:hypothetical protein